MQMMRSPAVPAFNLPQAVLELKSLLGDKDKLKDLVLAAQRITEANKLTEEEGQALETAQKIIGEAQEARKELSGLRASISELECREAAVAKKEQALKKAHEMLSGG